MPSETALFLPGVDPLQIKIAAERIQQLAQYESTQYIACKLCGKLNDWNHMRSKVHMQKVVEQAQLDVALGLTDPFRLRTLTPLESKGLPCGPHAQGLTKERFLAHWGNNVQSLCQFALDRFKAVGSILLLKNSAPWQELYKASLFVVSYGGQGKYSTRCAAIPWEMLPANNDEKPKWQLVLPTEASGASLWWPTIHVWLPGDHNSDNEYHWLPTASGTVLVVVCVYQWLWPMPQGWNVQLARWSRL